MRVARINRDVDIARLEIDVLDPPFNPPRLTIGDAQKLVTRTATVEPGDSVCSAVANPERRVQCGEVVEPLEHGAAFHDTGISVPGNSGSGVFDVDGNLVGIVTHMYLPHLGSGRRCVNIARLADWAR